MFSRFRGYHTTSALDVQTPDAVVGETASPAASANADDTALAEATAALGPGTIGRLRGIAPDTWMPLLRTYVRAERDLAGLDERAKRRAWWLTWGGVLASAVMSSVTSLALGRAAPVSYPAGPAGLAFATASGLLTLLFLWPANLAWPSNPDRRPSAEWRVFVALLLYLAAGRLSTTLLAALGARYGDLQILPASAVAAYARLNALLQVTAAALAIVVELRVVIIIADRAAVNRRRGFGRVLTIQALRRVATRVEVVPGARLGFPGAAMSSLARVAQNIEQEIADTLVGVSDPLKREVREFGATLGESIRALAVPIVASPQAGRTQLLDKLDVLTAALIASDWEHVVDPGVAQRLERRSSRRWVAGQGWPRLATWLAVTGVVSGGVWMLSRVSGATPMQIAPIVATLLGVLVTLAGPLDLFKRRDK